MANTTTAKTYHYFYALIEGFVIDSQALKRELFDAGFQSAHNRVAEAEAEFRKALTELLRDPPTG